MSGSVQLTLAPLAGSFPGPLTVSLSAEWPIVTVGRRVGPDYAVGTNGGTAAATTGTTLTFDSKVLSRQHALLERVTPPLPPDPVSHLDSSDGSPAALVTIQDLGSSNGTFVNGVQLEPKGTPTPLRTGDEVSFGIDMTGENGKIIYARVQARVVVVEVGALSGANPVPDPTNGSAPASMLARKPPLPPGTGSLPAEAQRKSSVIPNTSLSNGTIAAGTSPTATSPSAPATTTTTTATATATTRAQGEVIGKLERELALAKADSESLHQLMRAQAEARDRHAAQVAELQKALRLEEDLSQSRLQDLSKRTETITQLNREVEDARALATKQAARMQLLEGQVAATSQHAARIQQLEEQLAAAKASLSALVEAGPSRRAGLHLEDKGTGDDERLGEGEAGEEARRLSRRNSLEALYDGVEGGGSGGSPSRKSKQSPSLQSSAMVHFGKRSALALVTNPYGLVLLAGCGLGVMLAVRYRLLPSSSASLSTLARGRF